MCFPPIINTSADCTQASAIIIVFQTTVTYTITIMPAPRNTRESTRAPFSRHQTSPANPIESIQAGQSKEPFSTVLARSLQSRVPPSAYNEPIEVTIARYIPLPDTPPGTPLRVDSPLLSAQPASSHVWPDTSKIPASAYVRAPHASLGERSIHLEFPACLREIKRHCHTKAIFHDIVARCRCACPAEHPTGIPIASTPEAPIPLLDQTSARPSILLTGPEHAHPTMCLHTWEDMGGDMYKEHKVVVVVPARLGNKRKTWRGCWGIECSMNGKGSSLRCGECYTRVWLSFEARRAWRPMPGATRNGRACNNDSEDSDSEEDS
ncbi:hypothetical protein DPSP01_013652 [Paraphaeosphaeria sporulosa]